jgi:hypothetical protein
VQLKHTNLLHTNKNVFKKKTSNYALKKEKEKNPLCPDSVGITIIFRSDYNVSAFCPPNYNAPFVKSFCFLIYFLEDLSYGSSST